MNIKSLRIFIAIMEYGTLVRASENLNISQPAASRLLQILEQEIGETLFTRTRKRLRPTAEAEIFLPEAARILNSIDNIPDVFEHSRAQTNAPLSVLCLPRIINGLVIPALARLDAEYPSLRSKIEVCPRREFGRRLLHGKYSIGVTSLPVPANDLTTYLLTRAKLHVMLPRNHLLAGKTVLSPNDLRHENYIALDEHTIIRREIDQKLLSKGQALHVTHEVSNSETAYSFVRYGMGFTFADPVSVAQETLNDVVLIPWSLQSEIEIAYFLPDAPQIHPARNRFVKLLKHVASEKYGGGQQVADTPASDSL